MARPREIPSAHAIGPLVDQYRPLVLSVCRRLLRGQQDVEDACQETFARLVRNAALLHGSPAAWLATTARSVCLEMIRRDIRERRRREGLLQTSSAIDADAAQRADARQRLERALPRALEILEESDRELVYRRFIQRHPLRQIAAEREVSVATVSRHAADSLGRLAEILRELGCGAVSDGSLADHFADGVLGGDAAAERDEPLRFAPDWQALTAAVDRGSKLLLPGQRPLRVGFVLGYTSATVLGTNLVYHELEQQVWTASLLNDPMYQLVGIVEPGTVERPPVERTLREFELTAGLTSGDDVEGLCSLDVILIGIHFVIRPDVVRAIHAAVRSGVGLINEYWTGLGPTALEETNDLYLSAGRVHDHHEPPVCGTPVQSRVVREHPLLPGLREGDEFMVGGCGPVFAPKAGVEVCIVKGRPIRPDEHKIAGAGALWRNIFATGTVGRGRALFCGVWQHQRISRHLSVSPQVYMRGLLQYVAKREEEPA